jgi:hypothetical protein
MIIRNLRRVLILILIFLLAFCYGEMLAHLQDAEFRAKMFETTAKALHIQLDTKTIQLNRCMKLDDTCAYDVSA